MTALERNMTAEVLKAIAHPIRLGVLEILSEYEERTVSQLYEDLQCSQSMMSQQLQILEYHGLISSRKEGVHKFCSLRNPDVLAMLDCMRRHLYKCLSQCEIGAAAGGVA